MVVICFEDIRIRVFHCALQRCMCMCLFIGTFIRKGCLRIVIFSRLNAMALSDIKTYLTPKANVNSVVYFHVSDGFFLLPFRFFLVMLFSVVFFFARVVFVGGISYENT